MSEVGFLTMGKAGDGGDVQPIGIGMLGYAGPLSIEWEDSGMDRDWGAPDALAFVRRTDFAPSAIAFDAAMQRSDG